MSDLHDVLAKLRAEPPSALQAIAESSGVPYATLRKLRDETTGNPRYKTLEKLWAHYESVPAE